MGAKPQPHKRIVRDGKVITAAGVSAGIDLGLWLVGEIAGRARAEAAQLAIEYEPQPLFDTGHPSKASARTQAGAARLVKDLVSARELGRELVSGSIVLWSSSIRQTRAQHRQKRKCMANRKAFRGVPMEGWVARWYDGTARRERDETKALAIQVAERLPAEASVLEVAPGPGYLAIELAKLGNYRITGLDVSATLLQIASMNATREGVHVDFRHGDAADMPFEDDAFDFVICRKALQNFSEPVKALREMRRVLKASGTAFLGDIRSDVPSRVLNQHVRSISTGFWNWLVNQFAYRAIVKRRAHSKTQLAQLIAAGGFRSAEFREGPIFIEAWLGD